MYGGGLFEETMYRGGRTKDLLWRPLFAFGNGSSDSERPLDQDSVGRQQFWVKIIYQTFFQIKFDQELFLENVLYIHFKTKLFLNYWLISQETHLKIHCTSSHSNNMQTFEKLQILNLVTYMYLNVLLI